MRWLCSFLMFVGRICLGGLFIWAALDKMMHFDANAELIASKNISMVPLFLVGAFMVELLGGISLLAGWHSRFGALILMLYLVPVTLIFHNFWDFAAGSDQNIQINLFLKNVAIFGGLLYVLASGPGMISIGDGSSCACCKTNKE